KAAGRRFLVQMIPTLRMFDSLHRLSRAAMVARTIAMLRAAGRSDLVLVGFAIAALMAAQLMLSKAFYGTNFGGGDGKMAQAVILVAQKFGGLFQFNNINPIEGLGSQLLPMNVWLNPVYWPFAIFERTMAPDISAAVALGIFASACYVMARCFDVPM